MQIDRSQTRLRRDALHGLAAMALAALLVLAGCDALGFGEGNSDVPDRPRATSNDVINLPFFVRTEGGDPIDPGTASPSTPLVSDLGREPVVAPDSHQVTWGEWSGVDGSIAVACVEDGL